MILDNTNLLVLDTSVVLKWFLKENEPYREIALQILTDLTNGSKDAIIPDLLLYEVGNRLRSDKNTSLKQKVDYFLSLWDLPLLIIPLKKSITQLALEYAHSHEITYYDALFVATAFIADCPLYTADEKLLEKTSSLPYVKHLRDYATQKYQHWVDEAVQLIKTHYQPEKIILFGSMAKGKVRDGSDIDLLIIKETSLPLHKRIEEVLKILPLESPVEPHVYTPQEIDDRLKEGDPFLTNAFQKGTVVYEG